MGEFANKMGTKNPGNLVLSEDWNEVINEIDATNTDVTQVESIVETHHSDLENLTERIATAENQLTNLLSSIDNLRSHFQSVTLNTERSKFAFGESGVITATLTAIDGTALGSTRERPWIDFVTVWGRLKAASGFSSVSGEGGRTISVQVNAQGVAQVELSAESAVNVSAEQDASAAAVMRTRISSGATIATTLLAANTPQDTELKEAYGIVSQVYDNSPNQHFTHYADSYSQPLLWGGIQPEVALPNWFGHDYRTSIIAFVKGDNNPLTAEASLGSAAIQVSFRNWIIPWAVLDYQPAYAGLVGVYAPILVNAIDQDYIKSNERINSKIQEVIKGKGMLAQHRDWRALEASIGALEMTAPPRFLPEMVVQMQSSMRVQKTLNLLPNSQGTDAFALFAGFDAKSVGGRESFQQEMQLFVADEVVAVRENINTEVRSSQQQLREEIFSDTSANSLNVLQSKVAAIDNTITGLKALDSSKINREITKVEGLNLRLMQLENGVRRQ